VGEHDVHINVSQRLSEPMRKAQYQSRLLAIGQTPKPGMNRMNRLFRESYNPEGTEEALTTTRFAPPVDIYEDEHQLAVPDINEKDIDVHIENNSLTVHGKRKFEKEKKEENHRVERQYGSFARSFTLPNSVDPGQVSADYEKGVLKIKLAKRASQAQADQSEGWQREDARSQKSRQGRVKTVAGNGQQQKREAAYVASLLALPRICPSNTSRRIFFP